MANVTVTTAANFIPEMWRDAILDYAERKFQIKNQVSDFSSLLSGGLSKCIDKLEEEFGELKAALNTKNNEVHEAADLIYHLLVVLEAADVKFEDVLNELEKRKNQSGIEEKKNRK